MSVFIGLIALLVAFQLKHFLADYVLQGGWMLKKHEETWSFFLPLLSHVAVHGVFTFGLVALATSSHVSWWFCGLMAGLDTISHFCMDRLKASPKWLGRFRALSRDEYTQCTFKLKTADPTSPEVTDWAKSRLKSNRRFWLSLGLDQMVHHLTHYAIVFITVSRW